MINPNPKGKESPANSLESSAASTADSEEVLNYVPRKKQSKEVQKLKEFTQWELSNTNLHLKMENARLKGENGILRDELNF